MKLLLKPTITGTQLSRLGSLSTVTNIEAIESDLQNSRLPSFYRATQQC